MIVLKPILFILGTAWWIALFFIYWQLIVLFLKIKAEEEERNYGGFWYEHLKFFANVPTVKELLHYLPFSRYFRRFDTKLENQKPFLAALWQKKYQLELCWIGLLGCGFLAIPIVEWLFYPLSRQL